jgi:ketosteroid isomerase-like protein
MSQEDVDLIVRVFERGRSDPESFLEFCDPDIEWDMSRVMPEGRIYRGQAGVREFWIGWAGTFDDFDFRIDQLVDAGDGNVVVSIHQAGKGRSSGAAVEFHFGQVWTVSDGKVVRFKAYFEFDQALEAVGLRE